jgi:protein-tyrosine phosphatase
VLFSSTRSASQSLRVAAKRKHESAAAFGVNMSQTFVDIHCHLLPGVDDGAKDVEDSLAMARLAAADGTATIIATPHQLGNFGHNVGDDIRARVNDLRQLLRNADVPLQVLPGADVRIEPGMVEAVIRGDVLTLGDHGRHVLLELPHELYLPLEPVLEELRRRKIVGVLSHPERNRGILRQPSVLAQLVDAGCLMQITAGSLCGSFGTSSQQLCEMMFRDGLVHFVASDGHGPRSRRPLLRGAFERIAELTDEMTASALCSVNPGHVAEGEPVRAGRRERPRRKRSWFIAKAST